MMNITFDTNLLIDIEEKRDGYNQALEIVGLHNIGKIKLCIPAIIASEKLLNDNHMPDYKLFEEYLDKLGIINYEELMPLMYFDICYWGHSLWAGGELSELDILIHKILFPNIEPDHAEYCNARNINIESINPKWRNAKIDVQVLWCHIYHKKDIFITRDGNFKKKWNELNKHINGLVIMSPSEFIEHIKGL